MGAFITGLIGRAEQQRDKEELREFQEAKQERDRKRQLVDYAGQMAIQKGDFQSLPALLGALDELGPPPGTPKGMKDPYKQLGGKLAQVFGLRKKQQQQQQQRQQADQQYQQITGQPPPGAAGPVQTPPMPPPSAPVAAAQQAQPNLRRFDPALMQAQATQPNGGQPPQPQTAPRPQPSTPPMRPGMQGLVNELLQGKQRALAEAEAQGEKTFQTERKHEDVKSGDTRSRKLADQQAYYNAFISQGMPKERAEQLSEEIAFGKIATPPKRNVREIPNIEGTPYGQPGKTGTLEIDLNNPDAAPVFRPTAKPAGAGRIFTVNRGGHKLLFDATGKQLADLGAQDEPLAWKQMVIGNKVWYAPFSTRTHAQLAPPQEVLPEGETTTGAPQAGSRTQTPPIPPPRKPVAAATPPAATPGAAGGTTLTPPPGVPKGAKYGGEKFSTSDKTLMSRAETAMKTGVAVNDEITQLRQQHPDWFGMLARLDFKARQAFGASHPELANMLAKVHSVQNFLPSLHGLRGKYPIESWERVLQDPLVNPQATQDAIKGALMAAEEYRKAIQSGDYSKVINVSDLEKETGGGSAPTPEELDYMKKHGLQ